MFNQFCQELHYTWHHTIQCKPWDHGNAASRCGGEKQSWGFFLADVLWQGGGEIVFPKRKWLILYFILFYFCSCRQSVDKWVLQSWYISN